MKVSGLDLDPPSLEFLKSQGFDDLYPPQADGIRAGLLSGSNVLVSAPTASGKTLIATMAILGYLSKSSGKAVYLSPLRALASEKYAELKKMQGHPVLGQRIRVAISTGDFDGLEQKLHRNNVLVMTNEKMDSIIRHGPRWLDEIGLVIADEVHLLGDSDRGPTLEMVLTRLKRMGSAPQIVGLSATITNSEEIAAWLGCKLVRSDWRPVPLLEGVCHADKVTVPGGKDFTVTPSQMGLAADLGVQSVHGGGQALVFAETRTRSVSLATKTCKAVAKLLEPDEAKSLAKVSDKILSANENTDLVKRLAELVRQGVAFHHAGLNQNCRETVESEFRSGRIKLISSTPTLAAGVNLPARRVVISSISRYDAKRAMNMPISVMEYKQLCGRAGRPQYDDHGESIVVAGNNYVDDIVDRYVLGEPEPILSRIASPKSLRIHALSVIATNPGMRNRDLLDFFSQTLGGCQDGTQDYQHDWDQYSYQDLESKLEGALDFLSSSGLIVGKGERYAATTLGKKTSMLYIDPSTAIAFAQALDEIPAKKADHSFGILHLASECDEFFPKFGLRDRDYPVAESIIQGSQSEMLRTVYEWDCNRSLLALYMWVTESSELSISVKLGIESGDLHRLVESADRLLYCMRELAKGSGSHALLGELDDLRRRVAYGVSKELLDLVRVRGVGRVRARALFKNGIKDRAGLASAPLPALAKIDKIGPAIAKSIKLHAKKTVR